MTLSLTLTISFCPGPGWSGDGPLGEHRRVSGVWLAGEQGGLRHGVPGPGGGAPHGEGSNPGPHTLLIPVKCRVQTADCHRW